MGKIIPWAVICVLGGLLVGVSVCSPDILSDTGNDFLKNFVSQELLSFLGVVVTITLASAANLQIELNRLESVLDRTLTSTRRGVKLSAYTLLWLLVFGIVIVFTKPYVGADALLSSLWNSAAMIIVFCNLWVLFDLTSTVLAIPSTRDITNGKK